MKVLYHRQRISEAGATALFVVHDEPELVRRTMLAGLELPFPVLVDLDRTAYAAWGMTRASSLRIWGDPRVWLRYLNTVLHGQRPTRFGADTLQLGGDFVVAADGTIAYARPQRTDDRPPVAELLRALGET
ncbi:MAG TPA: peroxiredoxin-like family protein [Gaiellaceae bacterium]|nr:peroxiredoxin-like family protein [Gaiellaceae bacterium]